MHTPGPWIAASAPSSIVGWPVVAQNGRSICSVSWAPHVSAEFKAECAANARLIEAAPQLHDALQIVKTTLDEALANDELLSVTMMKGLLVDVRTALANITPPPSRADG